MSITRFYEKDKTESSQIILLRTLNFRVEDEKNLAGTQDAKLNCLK
jgi:hypothetical protein